MNTHTAIPASGRVITSLLGRSLDPSCQILSLFPGAEQFKDAYKIPTQQGEAWLFDYGVMIFWGVPLEEYRQLTNSVLPHIEDPIEEISNDLYSYLIDETQTFRIHNDRLFLSSDNTMARLALSHAFAQSIKLIFFEDKAEAVIADNLNISRNLARNGRIPFRRRKLAQLRGLLFDTSSDITLHFNLLDKPGFFWDYPELDEYYIALAQYLELQPRVDILNQKLNTIHDLLEMLATEQHHKHSSFLEWIIIILIAMEIVLYFIGKYNWYS